MKKGLLLILLLSGLWLNGFTQGSFQQYYYAGGTNRLSYYAPVLGYHIGGNWYVEGRYNYEEINTGSLYVGKTFEHETLMSYTSITPIIGAVAGTFKGGAIGANVELDYRRLVFSSQSQYTFSIENKTTNFVYSWSDLEYRIKRWLALGVSLQQTNVYSNKGTFEKGVFIMLQYKSVSLPVYLFNPSTNDRYYVVGLNIALGKIKKRKDPFLPQAKMINK